MRLHKGIFLGILIFSFLGCKRDQSPEPEFWPLYTLFILYHIEDGDSTIAGGGKLVQTKKDETYVEIELSEPYRKNTGNFNISIHQLNKSEPISNAGTMPANNAKWESDILKPINSRIPFTFDALREGNISYVRIMDGTSAVAVGRWGVYP